MRAPRTCPAALLIASTALLCPLTASAQSNNDPMMDVMGDGEEGEAPVIPDITNPPEFNVGTRPAGMGEAHIALSEGTGGTWHNPAGLARAYMYAVEGTFAYTPTGNVLSAAVIDSKTNPKISAGAGVGYYFSRGEGPEVTALDIRVPLAVPVVPDRVSVGLGGRFVRAKAGELEILRGFTLDAGALFRLWEGLHAGVTAKNLLDPCKNVMCEGFAPLTVGAGMAYAVRPYAAAADVEFDFSGSEVGVNVDAGGEYLIAEMVPVRLGYQFESLPSHHIVSAGTGWKSKTAGIDLGYQHNLNLSSFGRLLLGVSVYF